MSSFLITAALIALTLGAIAHFAQGSSEHGDDGGKPPVFSLLPGDYKYESPNGNFKFYFPITTSIVVSLVLSLVLRFFG